MKIAVVMSRFNEEITSGLLHGVKEVLREKKIDFKDKNLFYAPGAFEMPLLAQTLAQTKKYDGVICLGCVIKGDTAHFEFISLGSSMGIMQAMLATRTPIAFGILTTYTEEQAHARSRKNAENKGREAALAVVETVERIKQIKKK